ncbi:hypothetical protein M8J76_017176 [Diaphorina citri]|nr:hypothetical protein M8J76_017176 [Diaphorina citri]
METASLDLRQASERALSMNGGGEGTPGGGGGGGSDVITIIHYNDVYNVEERKEEPVAGAPRFVTAVKSFSHLNPLILFSGDVYSPSMLSTFTKGEHMSKVLNELNTHCAVLGNHEFDFGLEILKQRLSECTFPWLMSNVIDNETGRPLGEGKISHAIQWNGKRIGLMGLVEQEWLETLASVDPEEITYLDYCEVGRKLGAQLRSEGCDYVIALTHMRTPNDIRLAEEVDEIDLILGGHDHVYEITSINGKYIIKSGTDFRQFSRITVDFSNASKPDVRIEEINVTSQYARDQGMIDALRPYDSIMEGKLDEELGHFAVELDARFSVIRTQETNMGNWISDVLLAATGTDCVLLNSGTFRSDKIHPPGPFTYKDLVLLLPDVYEPGLFTLGDLIKLLPIRDPTVVIQVTGEQLWLALENAVCKYPKLEGRFPQVAGLSFAFDPNQPPGSRVDPKFVRIGDEYLDFELKYSMATKQYLQKGCDGYTVFQNAPVLVDDEDSPELGLAIQNHFEAIKMKTQSKRHTRHRQSLVTLSRRHSLIKSQEGELDVPSPIRRASLVSSISCDHMSHLSHPHPPHHHHSHSPTPTHTHPRMSRRASLDDLENESCLLAPKIENRIVILTPEKRRELSLERQLVESDAIIPEEENESGSPRNNSIDAGVTN